MSKSLSKKVISIAVATATAFLIPTVASNNSYAASSVAASCQKGSLKTLTPGVLTIATDNPVYSPWFENNDPTTGKGFEAAVAAGVAQQLGYDFTNTKWVRIPFDSVIQPGKKKFDFAINEFSITADRQKAVDFSAGYYDVKQAIVTIKGSKIANAKSIADLKNAKIGASVGSTSYQTITNVIKPKQQPAVFNTNDDAVTALKNKQIDGLIVDLPTAYYIADAELTNGVIVGQFAGIGKPEQFGLVLQKNSPITKCVSQAVNAYKATGAINTLEQAYLAGNSAPVLK
jgi:polar amino acid transport system substrate-binding protein